MEEVRSVAPATVMGKSSKKRWIILGIIILAVLILGGGGFCGYKYLKAKRAEASKPAQFVPNFDFDHGLTRVIKAAEGGKLTVIDYQNVAITLQIPAGALAKDTKISMLPIKKTGELRTDPGVYITPSDLVFNKAATINYDFSNSKVKNEDAIASDKKRLSFSSGSHVYRVNYINHTYMPQLVARAAETRELLSGEILGTGVYVYSLDGRREIENAEEAFENKKVNNAALLESATTLLYNGKKLSDKQSKLANGAMRAVYSSKNPDPFEIYAAIQLDNLQNGKGPNFWQKIVSSVHAEVLPGLMEYTCKTTSRDPDELYSV